MKSRTPYTRIHIISAVFLAVTLLWLTVSLPFLTRSQDFAAKKAQTAQQSPVDTEDDNSNPFGNTTEEKAPSSTTLSEEYLHDQHTFDSFFSVISLSHASEDADTYIAFHGEMLVPPPNVA